jgi:hypothetical protein
VKVLVGVLAVACLLVAAAVPAAQSANAPPVKPGKYAAAMAKFMLEGKYDQAWAFLNPVDQKVLSENAWIACHKKHPVASGDVKINAVLPAGTTPSPTVLPVLGKVRLWDTQVQIRFHSAASSGLQAYAAVLFWLKYKGKWTAVWLADTYNSYKKGNCGQTPPAPPALY